MAINLNLPSMMGTPYTTEADKLISDIKSFQAPDIPTPPPTIPKLTGFGDKLARIGGFGDEPGELKTKEELEKMTQAEIDAYVRQRKQARRLGTSEALIQFGEALQGKPAAQNALAREQARKNLELQNQYQKDYENAIRMAEQTNPQQARLLRSLGLPGYINLQQKRAEEYFLGSEKPGSVERFSIYSNKLGRPVGSVLKTDKKTIAAVQADPDLQIVPLSAPPTPSDKEPSINTWTITNAAGDRVKDLVNPTQDELRAEVKAGNFLNKTPVLSTAGKGAKVKAEEIKGWTTDDGLYERARGVNPLIASGNRIIKNLYENPGSVLITGDISQVFAQMSEEMAVAGYLIDPNKKEAFVNKAPSEVRSKFKDLANSTSITESQLLDFAYQIAKVRGQEGRGLSDQDFKNFQKIISAGRTAEQKIKALSNFIEGIQSEVETGLQEEKEYRNLQVGRDKNNQEAIDVLQGIEDIYTVGFAPIYNPYAQPTPTPGTVEDPLGLRQ
jgi:hypothetical protein